MKTQNVSVSYMRKLTSPKLRGLRSLLILSDRKDPVNGEPCAVMMSWRQWQRIYRLMWPTKEATPQEAAPQGDSQ